MEIQTCDERWQTCCELHFSRGRFSTGLTDHCFAPPATVERLADVTSRLHSEPSMSAMSRLRQLLDRYKFTCMRKLRLEPLVLFMLAGVASGQTASLRQSCSDAPFLSITASAPRHDSFVNVELGLVDPKGRTAGTDRGDSIPRSQYGKIVEMPLHPERSKAIAIEICDAVPGTYLISIAEHGDFDYRLDVTRDAGPTSDWFSQPVHLHAEGDRVCRFRFNFRMIKRKTAIERLDKAGHPSPIGEFPIEWLDKMRHPLPFGEFPTCEGVARWGQW